MNKNGRIIGLIIVIVVILLVVIFKNSFSNKNNMPQSTTQVVQQTPLATPNLTVLKCMIAGEKEDFINDPEIKQILADHNIAIDYKKVGSLEMTDLTKIKDYDCVFPSSASAVDTIKNSTKTYASSDVFRSPLVFYSWDIVVNPLIKQGLIRKDKDTYYANNLKGLFDLILSDKKWSDIGLPSLYGNFVISTSDPAKTNSGSVFAALVANTLNKDNIISQQTLSSVIVPTKSMFDKLGFKKTSTSDLFEEYLKTGVGTDKIIVGYENQIIEFSQNYPDVWTKLQENAHPVIIYPEPTIWSFHTIIALTPQAKQLIDIIQEPKVQEIAWKKHGFRTGVVSITNDTSKLTVKGIPNNIDKVMTLPDPKTMESLIKQLSN